MRFILFIIKNFWFMCNIFINLFCGRRWKKTLLYPPFFQLQCHSRCQLTPSKKPRLPSFCQVIFCHFLSFSVFCHLLSRELFQKRTLKKQNEKKNFLKKKNYFTMKNFFLKNFPWQKLTEIDRNWQKLKTMKHVYLNKPKWG